MPRVKEVSGRMMEKAQKILCEKLGVEQLSMMVVAELKSNKSMRIISCDNVKEHGVMGVAELKCVEFDNKKKEHYCGSGGGQREGTSLECTVCTVVWSGECGESMNGPSATNLATSRVKRCTFTFTKGGPSVKRGGGQASEIIRRFEERKGNTDNNIAHSSDSSDGLKYISVIPFISSKKISFPIFGGKSGKAGEVRIFS